MERGAVVQGERTVFLLEEHPDLCASQNHPLDALPFEGVNDLDESRSAGFLDSSSTELVVDHPMHALPIRGAGNYDVQPVVWRRRSTKNASSIVNRVASKPTRRTPTASTAAAVTSAMWRSGIADLCFHAGRHPMHRVRTEQKHLGPSPFDSDGSLAENTARFRPSPFALHSLEGLEVDGVHDDFCRMKAAHATGYRLVD